MAGDGSEYAKCASTVQPTDLTQGDSAAQCDEHYMRLALAEADAALASGEVPIGAVVVRNNEVISTGHNMRETWRDPTAHAEVIAIRAAASAISAWRLTGCTLYVTIEPCPMCAGALVLARLDRLVYGAPDPKAGAVSSLYNMLYDPRLNHRMYVTAGILESECALLMKRFFRALRL